MPSAPVGGDANAEPWYSLWSSLCHQNDVYPASFAAVPHIIEAAANRVPIERTEYLHLSGYIECCRHGPQAPPIPPELQSAYRTGLVRGAELTEESLRAVREEGAFQVLLGCLAAFRGFPQLGAGVVLHERELDCPHCGQVSAAPGFDHYA